MNKVKIKFTKIVGILLILIVSGCSSQVAADLPGAGNSGNSVKTDSSNNSIPENSQVEETTTPEVIIANSTPTLDLRTPPVQWKDWPIVPETTNNAISIYETGILQGVNAKSFSKIGDCQNIKEAFFGIYDLDGRYFLREDELNWQETIDNFKGFFNKDGEAIKQGLNVAAALSPLHANPDICQPSESPLDCELRIANPSFAFISFERWWPNETPPEVYEKYMRTIIQRTIEHGTVPILVTKADDIEGNHQINQIIANLAFEFDIPLYNWWKAAQFLPHRGMVLKEMMGFIFQLKHGILVVIMH